MIDKIKADVRAVSKLASRMTRDQKEVLHGVLHRIMTVLIEKGFEDEADQIEDVIATIFTS
jgi:HD-like signal output (HDOD) protein